MIGTGEIVVILVVILILFGGKKLPEFAQSLGKGIREFKKACSGDEESEIIVPVEIQKESFEEKKRSRSIDEEYK